MIQISKENLFKKSLDFFFIALPDNKHFIFISLFIFFADALCLCIF